MPPFRPDWPEIPIFKSQQPTPTIRILGRAGTLAKEAQFEISSAHRFRLVPRARRRYFLRVNRPRPHPCFVPPRRIAARPFPTSYFAPSTSRAPRRAFTLPKQRAPSAFTLIELLVVMGIITALLIAVIPAVTSMSKSSGRKGAISNLLGAVEQARAEAIKTGQSTYVVFPTFTTASQTTLDRYNFRSYAIFEDDPAAPTAPKQLTNWKALPTGISIRSKTGSPESLTNLPLSSALTPVPTFSFTPESTATPVFYCIKFNANGEVESPPNNVTLAVFEGFVNGGNETTTSAKDANGDPAARESIAIARLTGRVSRVQ